MFEPTALTGPASFNKINIVCGVLAVDLGTVLSTMRKSLFTLITMLKSYPN